MRISIQSWFVTVFVSVTMSGCGNVDGPRLATVTGKVTVNGKPVPRARITFIPERKGSPSYGGTNADGVYRAMYNQNRAGAELGKHNVIIENPEPETDDAGNLISGGGFTIPEKYRHPGLLKADIKSGSNEVDFALDATNN